LKGTNIILGDFNQVVVLDWGLAKDMGAKSSPDGGGGHPDRSDEKASQGIIDPVEFHLTAQGTMLGTLAYMAPEQARQCLEQVGPRSDVFSLGAILYEILTGRPPYKGKTAAEIIQKACDCEFDPPRKVVSSVPKALEAICLQAMAKEPPDRYASAGSLAHDLRCWLADEPIEAMPDPWTTWLRRWVSRHRTPFCSTAASLTVALLVGGTLLGYFLNRSEVVALERREESRRHALQVQEEAKRHSEQVNDMIYVNTEKTAAETIGQGGPGSVARGLGKIREAVGIPTPMRSVLSLRSLAVKDFGRFDLVEGWKITSINSACLAFSRDGRRLAIGEHHQRIYLADGLRLALGDIRQRMPLSYRVQVFDIASKTKVNEYSIPGGELDTPQTGVSALSFSPDRRWLVAGLRSGKILAWDTRASSPSPIALLGHKKPVRGLDFMPNGTTLISGSHDGVVKLWDGRARWTETHSFDLKDTLSSFSLSPDGHLLACASGRSAQIFDLRGLEESPPRLKSIFDDIHYHWQIAFSPDGQTLVANDASMSVVAGLGRGKGGRMLIDPDFGSAHTDEINRLEFHPFGSLLVSGSDDNTLKVWDLAADQLIFTMAALTNSVVFPRFSPDGRTLAVATSEGTTLYEVLGFETMSTHGLQQDQVRAFTFVAGWASDPQAFATITLDRYPSQDARQACIVVWGSEMSAPRFSIPLAENPEDHMPYLAIAAHPSLPLFAHNRGRAVRLHDVDRQILVKEIPEKRSSALRFSPDGRRLWSVIDEERIVSWSLPDLELQTGWSLDQRIKPEGRIGIPCLAAGSRWVVAGSRAGLVYMLRPEDGQVVRVMKASSAVQSIALSCDESRVICGLIDGRMALFDLTTGKPITEFPAHQDTIHALAIQPTTGIVATASRDKTVGLWRVDGSAPSEIVRIPSPSGRPILSVGFSPDGKLLGMLVQNERAVRVWDLDRLRSRLKVLGLDWE